MKLNALAAAALAAACLAAPALAADPPSTALPLGTPNGTTFNEATYFDGSYFFPKSLLHGWTGSAIKPLSLDANGFPSVHVLDSVLPTGGATSGLQTTGNGFLQTLAGAVSGGVLQTACTSGCSGGGGGSGGAVTQSGTWTVNLGTLNGAATAAGQASLLTALGTPLQAGGAVTVTGGPTASGQSAANTSLATIAANTAASGVGGMAAVPAGSTNGTALTLPAGSRGLRFYLGSADTVTFTIATSAPSSAPAATYTISGASSGTGPNWDESLSGSAVLYVTAKTGAPVYRPY